MKIGAALAAGLMAVLIGCGGGDSTTTVVQEAAAPESTTSKPESDVDPQDFIDAADAICEEFNSNLDQFPRANAAYFKASAASTDELRALEPPPELETTWNQYLGALEDQDAATMAGDDAERKAADNRKEIAGRKLGFAECGTG